MAKKKTDEQLAAEETKLRAIEGIDIQAMEERTAIQARMQAMRSLLS